MENQIIVYENGEIELNISIEEETIWLTQKQIAILFDKDVRTINEHIKFIYKEDELQQDSTIRKFRIVQKEGKREVAREVNHYNLDMILSIGYRVSSKKATKFRQWATQVLKEYIFNGYAINREKITQQRIAQLEQDVKYIKTHIQNNTLEIKQGVFFNGEIWDAYELIHTILKEAKNEVILIDNYIDESVLTLFSKFPHLQFTIITKKFSKTLELDLEKYNAQYNNVKLSYSSYYHDRFLILDATDAYHIGASIKDLGKKVFAFSKIDITLVQSFLKA